MLIFLDSKSFTVTVLFLKGCYPNALKKVAHFVLVKQEICYPMGTKKVHIVLLALDGTL